MRTAEQKNGQFAYAYRWVKCMPFAYAYPRAKNSAALLKTALPPHTQFPYANEAPKNKYALKAYHNCKRAYPYRSKIISSAARDVK